MALEVSPILLPMIFAPALTLVWVTRAAMAYESSMVISGQVLDSWTTGFRSFSAWSRSSAAFLRSASDSIGQSPRFWSSRGEQLPQHVRHDPAVAEIIDFDGRVDTQQQRHFPAGAVKALDDEHHVLLRAA